MQQKTFRFSNATVQYYFSGGFTYLKQVVALKNAIIITDENVFAAHTKRFKGWNTIVLKPGEQYKIQATVDSVIEQLIAFGADRTTTLVGVGGGVVTDLTGYIASVFMRGIAFGFVPTTLLSLVDASIGGKNGIDVGIYKNMVGTFRQPTFILHDLIFLNSLPQKEWQNGFAEIIKHACIKDAVLFKELEEKNIDFYRNKKKEACRLIQRNALIKTKVVLNDEFEKGERKILNFGHTLGHALENQYHLMHGEAVAIGMVFASRLSGKFLGFKHADRVEALINKFDLPTSVPYEKDLVFKALISDKKKENKLIHFILLERIGKGKIQPLSFDELYAHLK
jgi:3-dehydroquinate synthase